MSTDSASRARKKTLTLEDGPTTFTARLPSKPGVRLLEFAAVGSKVAVTGVCVVQAREGFKGQASLKLTNTAGAWRTDGVTFVRQEGVPVRLVIDNTSVGEGNTLLIRSVEVLELP